MKTAGSKTCLGARASGIEGNGNTREETHGLAAPKAPGTTLLSRKPTSRLLCAVSKTPPRTPRHYLPPSLPSLPTMFRFLGPFCLQNSRDIKIMWPPECLLCASRVSTRTSSVRRCFRFPVMRLRARACARGFVFCGRARCGEMLGASARIKPAWLPFGVGENGTKPFFVCSPNTCRVMISFLVGGGYLLVSVFQLYTS